MQSSFTIPSVQKLFLSGMSIFLGAFFFTLLLSGLFSIQESVQQNAAQSLGGDVKIRSNTAFSIEQREKIQKFSEDNNTEISYIDSFTGMVIAENSETLTSLSGVDSAYPLYGSVEMMSGIFRHHKQMKSISTDHLLKKKIFNSHQKYKLGRQHLSSQDFLTVSPAHKTRFHFLAPRELFLMKDSKIQK